MDCNIAHTRTALKTQHDDGEGTVYIVFLLFLGLGFVYTVQPLLSELLGTMISCSDK